MRLSRSFSMLTIIMLLLIGFFGSSLLSWILSANAAGEVLTLKWKKTGLPTNWEGGIVIGDINHDGLEEIVYGGTRSNRTLVVLSPLNGSILYTYSNSRIGSYCQPQMDDIDGDGWLEILVPLYYIPGLAVLRYDQAIRGLKELWVRDVQGPNDASGSGSCMSKPVSGDINHDGKSEIFIASQDINFTSGYDGTLVEFDYLGNVLARTFAWRSCSGGLSLADTDNDGEYELYMGDRGMYMGDGDYGKGCRSFWAGNLTQRWNRPDFLCSSQAPILADVNGDGILDVIVNDQRGGIYVLNSTNGATIRSRTDSYELPVHYGNTVYDVDGDGRLEILMADGDHAPPSPTHAYIFDLGTMQIDKELDIGGWEGKWSPTVADVDPNSPGMELVMGMNFTERDAQGNIIGQRANLLVWETASGTAGNRNYNLIQNVTGLASQVSYPFVQDIDNNGYQELVVQSSFGNCYAYNTQVPKPSQRIRTEVTYFSEERAGAAEYVPNVWDAVVAPCISQVAPGDDALCVPVSLDTLSFRLLDHQGDQMSYSVTTSSNIGGPQSGTVNGNGTVSVPISGLQASTTYTWRVTASDGVHSTIRSYSFRTAFPSITGGSPAQGKPSLTSQDGFVWAGSTFVAANMSTSDPDGDKVTNVFNWYLDNTQVANVILPFNTRNATIAKDYSGNGNDAIIKGATWTSNGVVGGAYSFDGYNDYIMIPDGGFGYFNDSKAPSGYPYHQTLCGFTGTPNQQGIHETAYGNWTELTVEVWVFLTANNYGSRLVAKIPSYEIGFQTGQRNRVFGGIWLDANNNTVGAQPYSEYFSVTSSDSLSLNTWYHIVLTYKSGSGLRLYVNGGLIDSQTTMRNSVTREDEPLHGPIKRSCGEPVYIGWGAVGYFKGRIDEVRIYQRYMSPQQVLNCYNESKNGSSSSSVLLPTGLGAVNGDVLKCEVIPTDSYRDGQSAMSDSVTLFNTSPVANNLEIGPRSRPVALDNEDLKASYVYYDADGNPESGTIIRWYRNGALRSGLNNQLTVPNSQTSVGQTWYFVVTPKDGLVFGDNETSYSVTIISNSAPNTGTPNLVSSSGTNFDDEDLIVSNSTTSDSNGNEVTNVYHWFRNGTSWANLLMPFDTESWATVKDYSGYANSGTISGATWTENGVVGGAYYFDGSSGITIGDNPTLLGSGTWTEVSVEFWIKPEAAQFGTTTLAKKNYTASSGFVGSYVVGFQGSSTTPNTMFWGVNNGAGFYSIYDDPGTALDVGKWYHVVCTYKSGAGLTIYINGTQKANLPFTGSIVRQSAGLEPLFLGFDGGTNVSRYMIGTLDEVKIYSRALTSAQVFQDYLDVKDGLSKKSTVVAQETAANDVWKCQVIPNDSFIDGTARNSTQLTVKAMVGNSRPRIDWYSPANANPAVNEGGSLSFAQVSSDPNGDALSCSWKLDSVVQAATQDWTYLPDYSSSGSHTVTLTVSDGHGGLDSQEWQVTVFDLVNAQYELTIKSGPGGTTVPSGTLMYDVGAVVEVSAYPEANMKLNYWLLDDVNVGDLNPYTLVMEGNYNLTAVFVERSVNAYLAVRGAHDEIYYRIYNSTDSSWEDWRVIPEGATCDSPAVVMYSGKLYFVVRGMVGQSLWFGSVNLTDYSFSGWAWLDGATPSAPTLTVYDSKLVLVVRGFTNIVYYRYYDTVSETWGDWIPVPDGATCDSPAATVLGSSLHLVVRGFSTLAVGGNNTLWHGIVNLTDDSFSGWTSLPGATPSAPTLAASETLGRLYLSVRGMSDVIWTNTWNGATWEGWNALLNGATCDSPAVAVVNGELHVVVRGITGNALWHYYINLSTDAHSGWIAMDGYTPSASTLAC
jgi:hypothetical protein